MLSADAEGRQSFGWLGHNAIFQAGFLGPALIRPIKSSRIPAFVSTAPKLRPAGGVSSESHSALEALLPEQNIPGIVLVSRSDKHKLICYIGGIQEPQAEPGWQGGRAHMAQTTEPIF